MSSVFTIGLTGGIGSGKSKVADLFVERGAALVDTDEIAHRLTAPGGAAIPAIRTAFGNEVIAPDGRMDRAAMRAWSLLPGTTQGAGRHPASPDPGHRAR